MTTYRRLSFEETANRLLALENPLIVIHTRPDGDAVGSAAALAHVLCSIGKQPIIACTDEIPARLAPFTENLLVGAPQKGMQTVTVDVASRAQLGSLADTLSDTLAPCLQIDHHERGEMMADSLLAPDASATGEILLSLFSFMETRGMIPPLSLPALTCLYAAISSDTGGFRFANTAPDTHRAAAYLLERGVDAPAVNRLLFSSKSQNDLRAEALVLSTLTVEADGLISCVTVTREAREAAALPEEAFETAIDIARSLAGVEIAVAIKETAKGTFKISLRANRANVAEIASLFGGGGHKLAAGCTLAAETAEDAFKKIRPHAEKALATLKNP